MEAAAGQQGARGARQPPPPPPPPHHESSQAQLRRLENSSPYVQCGGGTEEYNRQGYGAAGHQQPVDNSRGAGATEGPTLSGGALANAQARAA